MAEKAVSLDDKWSFGPDVPTYDFFEHRDLQNDGDLEWVVNDLIESIERGEFLRWEAVVTQEVGRPLTEPQRHALGGLLNFNDEPSENRILYINGLPRPDRLWYQIVRVIAPHLLVERFRTADVHYAVTTDGWRDLIAALDQHGPGLSLPQGVEQPAEVVPADLRHRLWVQTCFEALSGLGQEEELTLRDSEEHYRIEEFIAGLRRHRDSVAFLDLTLEKLLTILVLPPLDEPFFIDLMTRHLGLTSPGDPLASHL
jgi:hypothetical protein